MNMVVVLMANGYEDIEAMSIIDVLRRGGVEVKTVGIGGKEVESTHQVKIMCDYSQDEFEFEGMEMLVLPGGYEGVENLDKSNFVKEAISYAVDNDIWLGAICMAPSILGKLNLLDGKTVTSFPMAKEFLQNSIHTGKPAERDGKIITGQNPAGSIEFSFMLLEALKGEDYCIDLKKAYHYCV
jgi:4-methyl-5(b-hydroxyethyl)-thiazole monophosphate biosynthesis